MHRLPDGSGFFVGEVDTKATPPRGPVMWNPFNKVLQDHRDGTIDHDKTNTERAKRGLPVPWTPALADVEVHQAAIA